MAAVAALLLAWRREIWMAPWACVGFKVACVSSFRLSHSLGQGFETHHQLALDSYHQGFRAHLLCRFHFFFELQQLLIPSPLGVPVFWTHPMISDPCRNHPCLVGNLSCRPPGGLRFLGLHWHQVFYRPAFAGFAASWLSGGLVIHGLTSVSG